jgi:hypothetical protein
MSERERWIVYPLLFFALGASLRDKFLQHVSTKEIECQRLVTKQIECEGGIIVLDPGNPTQRLVELGPAQPVAGGGGDPSRRLGVLILRDSNGQELCGVLNNALYVREIQCEAVKVMDPGPPQRVLAGLGSIAVTDAAGDPRRFGVLALNNEDFGTLTGNPPRDLVRQPPANAGDESGKEAPGDEGQAPDEPAEEASENGDEA